MLNRRRFASALILFTLFGVTVSRGVAQPRPGWLDEVLRKMDAASLKFQAAEADFQWDFYEVVVKQTTTQRGTIYFKKVKGKTLMGARVTSPAVKLIEYRDNVLRMFDPGSNHLTTITPKQNQAQIESFLTLGFGGSGKDMANAWKIEPMGDETIDGIPTAKMDLVPKDLGVHNTITHATIWIDTARGVPLKQVFFFPDGDSRTTVYKNIRYNQSIDMKPYQITTDSKTTSDSH